MIEILNKPHIHHWGENKLLISFPKEYYYLLYKK